jgi:hypothetical protein
MAGILATARRQNHVTEASETGEPEVNALSTVSNSSGEKLPDVAMCTVRLSKITHWSNIKQLYHPHLPPVG